MLRSQLIKISMKYSEKKDEKMRGKKHSKSAEYGGKECHCNTGKCAKCKGTYGKTCKCGSGECPKCKMMSGKSKTAYVAQQTPFLSRLFGGKSRQELNMAEAATKGIVPPPTSGLESTAPGSFMMSAVKKRTGGIADQTAEAYQRR